MKYVFFQKILGAVKSKETRIKIFFALALVAIQILILFFNYRRIDIRYPIVYQNGDEMGVFYYAKMIDEFGISLRNPRTGGANGSNMYDYPYADSLSFSMVKIISLFFDNPFIIINLFYFLCSILNALTSFFVMRRRGICEIVAVALSLLFSNSAYFQMRYGHMWLIPYFMIPIECDIALDILEDKILEKNLIITRNTKFIKGVFLAFICGFTGLYYAFFACVLFFSAFLIKSIKDNSAKKNMYSLTFICSTGIACLIQYIPNVIYLLKNGQNAHSEINLRSFGSAEYFGMKFIQLILPRPGHRLTLFARLTNKYMSGAPVIRINENIMSSIGIIATVGFFIALCLIIKNDEKHTNEPFLIIAIFLVATIGGIGSLFSLLIKTPMRCYNRMSLIIMFLSLIVFGKTLQRITGGFLNIRGKMIIAFVIIVLGVFDQTVTWNSNKDVSHIIDDQRNFIHVIENELDKNALVFQCPYLRWPSGGDYRMFVGYLFSDNLRWSYGAMQGREDAVWQEKVTAKNIEDFLQDITDAGYTGLYIDKIVYEKQKGTGSFQDISDEITRNIGIDPIVNGVGDLYFWNLKHYKEIN